MKLHGCRTLLTGAGSGIGRCLARELGARGARLVLVGRNSANRASVADEINSAGGSAVAVTHDLGIAENHVRLAERARALLGVIDLLINNAGVSSFGEYALEKG